MEWNGSWHVNKLSKQANGIDDTSRGESDEERRVRRVKWNFNHHTSPRQINIFNWSFETLTKGVQRVIFYRLLTVCRKIINAFLTKKGTTEEKFWVERAHRDCLFYSFICHIFAFFFRPKPRRFILIFMWFALRWRSRFVSCGAFVPSILRSGPEKSKNKERSNRTSGRGQSSMWLNKPIVFSLRHSTPGGNWYSEPVIRHRALLTNCFPYTRSWAWEKSVVEVNESERGSLAYQISSSPLLHAAREATSLSRQFMSVNNV